MNSVRSVLQRARDYGLMVFERERPFFSLSSLSMYALTLLVEIPVIFARFMLFVVVGAVVLIFEQKTTSDVLSSNWLLLPLVPTMWSALALFSPFGGAWWWRTRAGGRAPSVRERLAYQDAVELLQAHSETALPLPKRWFVLDTPEPDAAVIGDTLMLSRSLLEMDHLPAVLAHELGHLGTPDGRVTAALNRLVILSSPFGKSTEADDQTRPPREERPPTQYTPREPTDFFDLAPDFLQMAHGILKCLFLTSLLAKGGLGLWLTRPIWGRYWRHREYKADQYAANLGQAEELADFLEVHALIHDHPVPLIWLTAHTHPPTELRIDRLRNPTPQAVSQPGLPAAA